MQDATVGSRDAPTAGYSLQEAAALLGIGVNTLRRRIAAGQVRAEQVERPQGYVWRVYLDGRHPPTHPPGQEATGSLPHPPAPVAQAEALAALIQATLAPIVAPLVAEQAALRQANERQAERLEAQAQTIGSLTEQVESRERELVRASAEIAALSGQLADAEVSRRRDARRLSVALAVLCAMVLAAGLVSAMAGGLR